MESLTLELLAANYFGVLHRITGVYAKRGCNIERMEVCETENPDWSVLRIVSRCGKEDQEQLIRQLQKLYDVRQVTRAARSDTKY